MTTSNIFEAKALLSQLIEKAVAGEEVVISKYNRPMVRLVPVEEKRSPIQFGSKLGPGWVAPDFDAPLPDFNPYADL
jgi:prevent-host-death family protein